MSDIESRWIVSLEISPEQANAFQRLAAEIETTPTEILALMVRRVLRLASDLQAHGLPDFPHWLNQDRDHPSSEQRTLADFGKDTWSEGLGISAQEARAFERRAAELKLGPADVLARMISFIIERDGHPDGGRLAVLRRWMGSAEILESVARQAMRALPLRLRPTGFMWPTDKAFPWSPEDCQAAVIGYEVKWPGAFDDFMNLVRGKWEMSDGRYAILHQS